ncbi:MAG TPA: Smr/MutS family protein [Pyrinomonadaceae bacterium]|nr:Smr/MutS family protein [Pyrinomonadaceae bacterium]
MSLADWLRRLRAGRADDSGVRSGADVRAETEGAEEADDTGGEFSPFPEPVRLEIADTIDLHAFAPRDVRRAVEAYLEEAHRAGFRSVRIIHGRGRYVQRAAVRAILERTPFVAAFTDAPPERGGLGATVAHLRERNESEEGRRR